jgi:hypothetical protein
MKSAYRLSRINVSQNLKATRVFIHLLVAEKFSGGINPLSPGFFHTCLFGVHLRLVQSAHGKRGAKWSKFVQTPKIFRSDSAITA